MMTSGPEYTVMTANDTITLSERVTEMMRLGWSPQGGVNGFYTAAGYHYQQAMTKGA